MSYAVTYRQTHWENIKGLGKVEVIREQTSQAKSAITKRGTSRFSKKPFIPLMLAPFIPFSTAFAQDAIMPIGEPTMQEKMMTAFAPIIELVQSLAYPVALLVVLAGGLLVIIGNSDKGFSLIQRAGLGYVLVMMLPMLLDVLVDAMKSVV